MAKAPGSKVIKSGSGFGLDTGKTKMFGVQGAGAAPSGTSGKGAGGGKTGFNLKPGKTKMFGKQSAGPVVPGKSGK